MIINFSGKNSHAFYSGRGISDKFSPADIYKESNTKIERGNWQRGRERERERKRKRERDIQPGRQTVRKRYTDGEREN